MKTEETAVVTTETNEAVSRGEEREGLETEALAEANRMWLPYFEPFTLKQFGKDCCCYRSSTTDRDPPAIYSKIEGGWQVLYGGTVDDHTLDLILSQLGAAQGGYIIQATLVQKSGKDTFRVGDDIFRAYALIPLDQGKPPGEFTSWNSFLVNLAKGPVRSRKRWYFLHVYEAKPWNYNLVANFLKNFPKRARKGAFPSASCSGGSGEEGSCN